MSLDPRNFDPMRHEWWPSIVAMFSGKWTREAAMMDLRWHAVEVRVFRKAFPSRRQIMPRWGWTERRVRDLLASPEDWQDPKHPMSVEMLRGEKVPTRSQQGPNEVPARSQAKPTNADNRDKRSQQGPNEVPATSQQRPQARVSPSPSPSPSPPPLRGVQGGGKPSPSLDPFGDLLATDPFSDEAVAAFAAPPQPTPAPRPPVAPVAPAQRVYGAPASRLPAGVPSDLPALLSAGPGVRGLEVEGLRAVGRISVIECLLQAGIEDVEMLLTVDPARLPFCGVKDTVVASLRRHLRARWGLELGCLAEPERAPEPVRVPIVPGYPQYPHEGGYAFADRRYRERLAGIRPLDSFPEASHG